MTSSVKWAGRGVSAADDFGEFRKRNAEHVHLYTDGEEHDDADIRCARVVPLTSIGAIGVGSSELFAADRYRGAAGAAGHPLPPFGEWGPSQAVGQDSVDPRRA